MTVEKKSRALLSIESPLNYYLLQPIFEIDKELNERQNVFCVNWLGSKKLYAKLLK